MPTIPRRLAALTHLRDALAAINGAPDFFFRAGLVSIDPVPDALLPTAAQPVIMVQPTNRGVIEYHPAFRLEHKFEVEISAYLDVPGIDPDRKVTALEQLWSDIERAVTIDVTRGGVAVDTRLDEPQFFVAAGPDEGALLTASAEIKFHRIYGQP